jgi:hypothetical protein
MKNELANSSDVSSITNTNTILLNEDNIEELVELVATIPFPNETRKSKQVVSNSPSTRRPEFSVRCSLEESLREAKLREKVLKTPIAPSNPKACSSVPNARKRMYMPLRIPQVKNIPVGIDLDKVGSIPLVIDTFVHKSSPKSPSRNRRVKFRKFKMIDIVEESLKPRDSPKKVLIVPKSKNKIGKKKRKGLTEKIDGNEGSMDKLFEIYNCISVSILHATLGHLKRVKLLVMIFVIVKS